MDNSERDRIRDEIAGDLDSGSLEKLTFSVGRQYGLKSDGQIRQVQRELLQSGHLVQVGKQYRAA